MADLSSYINITANTVTAANLSTTGNVVSNSAVSTTGNITGNYIVGNGSTLSSLTASNVSGTVANATYALNANASSFANQATTADTANAVAGANVSGTVASATNATTAGTVTTAAQSNITSVGTLTSVAVTGNVTSGGLTVNGTGVVTGNLQIQGNLIYNNLTNITTANLVFGLANTTTGISANGAGFVVGNTSEASFLYNYTAQTWNSNIGVSAVGNITGGNIETAGLISAAGNVTGSYIIGNGSQLTGVTAYTNANVAAYLPTYTGNVNAGNVTATANVSGGNVLTGGVVSATGNLTAGNVSATNIVGTLTTASQTNITSVGTLGALTVTANITGGNITTAGQVSATGNITTANSFVGNLVGTTVSVTGNVSAGNVVATSVVVNGQPTTYGVVNPQYISVTNNTPQNIANVSAGGTTLTWDTTLSSNGITYSAGGFALTAGLTYQIQAEISLSNYSGYMIVQLVDVSNNSQIGSPQQATIVSSNAGFTEANNGTLDFIYTPVANQTVAFRVVSGSTNITGQHRGTGFSRASIVQINPTIAVQATATGTFNSTIGNVTLSNSYTQVVAASSPGTVIFTLPTLQPGTYLITARAKYNGSYSVMGIFTGGSQVADTSAFSWYQASGSVNNGLNGTWVLTVTTPTVYTINVWGGGTVQAGSDGSAVANYIQLNPTFALNALDTMTTTGNVTVGGILSSPQQTKASNATGTVGQICWDANYIYVCTATNTWKRTALTGGY
jgi:hypothetical protein